MTQSAGQKWVPECFGSDIGVAYWSLVRLSNRTFCFPELIPFLRNDGYTLASGCCRDPSRFASPEKLNLMKLFVSTRGGWAHFLTQTHTQGCKNRAGTPTLCVFLWCHLHFCGSLTQTHLCFQVHNREEKPTQNAKFFTLLRFIVRFTTFGMCLPSYPHCSLCSKTRKGIRNLDGCEF